MNLPSRSTWYTVGKSVFGTFFVIAGIGHFVSPGLYLKIMPPYLPWHESLVFLSGIFEVGLGASLLIPRSSRLAAWGLIVLLVAVFPANIYLFMHQEILPASPILHFLRLPLQGVFIFWAYVYTRPRARRSETLETTAQTTQGVDS